MTVLESFLKYVSYETTAQDERSNSCSNDKMLVLANEMLEELQALKPDEISINRFGVIDCKFHGDESKDSVAFLAHMDTSPSASDKDVKARIIDYKGGDIELKPGLILSEKEFTSLKQGVGHKLVVTDGNTLLGGDDKAGMAIIMTSLREALKKKDHRPLEIIFTTDEEIGADAKHISMEIVNSKYGYTIDGGDYRGLSIESFTAYGMDIHTMGKSIHPGYAKDKLVNASTVLIEFIDSLPKFLRPEHTDKREPFYHLCGIKGNEDESEANMIIRSFDEVECKELISIAELSARRINDRLGYEALSLDVYEQYHNMKQVLDKHPEILKEAEEVYKEVGIPYGYEAIRGGTTGSQLSFMGLPTPNLGTGDYNCHGRFEYVDVYEMEKMCEVVTRLMTR